MLNGCPTSKSLVLYLVLEMLVETLLELRDELPREKIDEDPIPGGEGVRWLYVCTTSLASFSESSE